MFRAPGMSSDAFRGEALWATGRAYSPRHVKAQPHEVVLQPPFCYFVHLVERVAGVGAAEADASALDGEDGVVEVALWSRESARDGKGACDVCNIGTVFLCNGSGFRAKEPVQWLSRARSTLLTPPASTRTRSLSLLAVNWGQGLEGRWIVYRRMSSFRT
jgi:hypothetical protein